jgi:2-dehydropantoate 2-reductase
MTRIAFLGLGGVGGYCGAKMAREYAGAEGVQIIFLAREKTGTILRENGIKLITPEETFIAHPHEVCTPSDKTEPVDFLICSVKSYDLESSLQQFSQCITNETTILPLMNGVDGEERIRTLFPECDVWSGCIYIVSRITAPGVITETGNIHKLHFGAENGNHDNLNFLFDLMADTLDVTLHHHTNIRTIVWEKYVFISPLASITSYLDVCVGKVLENPVSRKMLEQLLNEICAVAVAEKIILPEDIVSTTLAKMGKLPYETTSSMHSDFQKNSQTEFRSLTGHVVQLAKKHRLSAPAYETILRGLETRSEIASSHN